MAPIVKTRADKSNKTFGNASESMQCHGMVHHETIRKADRWLEPERPDRSDVDCHLEAERHWFAVASIGAAEHTAEQGPR